MSEPSETGVIYWTQPMDAMAEDLIQFNGQLLPPSSSEKRRQIVETITDAAEGGWHHPVAGTAWVARYKSIVLAEVPTTTATGAPGAAIVVCVRADNKARRPEVGDLVTGLTKFGQQAGYELDGELARQTMEEVVRRCQSWPFRAVWQLRRTFQGIFGR
jgi:hypothetical protein